MFRGSKKAEMGIGTLILFIAMILVAAIAAGVLIQTATNLQSKALETGSRSTRQVSTAVGTVLVYGEDASDSSIDSIFQNVKLVAGSEPVKLNDSVISVDLNNASEDLTYSSTEACDASVASGSFAAKYLINASEHLAGYISVGDVVQLCYALPNPVGEDQNLRITFIPKVGSVMTIRAVTPEVMTTKRVFLYP